LWMAREAHDAGLVFDASLLTYYVNSGCDPIRHDPLNPFYRLDNRILGAKSKLGSGHDAFSGGLRHLTNARALSVRVASSAVIHLKDDQYQPANLKAFADATKGFEDVIEPVVALPENDLDVSALGCPRATS
jgi:hypothetical protein